MDISLLIESIIGLIILLLSLLFIFFYIPKKKKEKAIEKKKKEKKKVTEETNFNKLMRIIKNQQSTTQELKDALYLILKHHGIIPNKLGIRVAPEFYLYSEIIVRLCRHKNTNKELIINFYHQLEKKNPSYKREIHDSLTKGLNSLG